MIDNQKILQKRMVIKSSEERLVRSVLGVTIFLLLTACANPPSKLNEIQLERRTTEVLDDLFGQYPAVQHELTLGEAMARALLFNLDDRVQLLKIAVEQKVKKIDNLDLLPKLVLDAGYSNINESLASYNKSAVPGATRSTLPMVSTDDESTEGSLRLAWNFLDFGLSYVRSKQQSDRIFIAEARRQQVMQNVLADVRTEFWRAYAAQQWERTVEDLLADLKIGLENSRRAGDSGAVTKEEALRVQSALLETMGDLLAVKKRLVGAQNRLAALMNLRPGESYRLTVDMLAEEQIEKEREAGFIGLALNKAQVEALEEKALVSRPELKIADYNVRITRREAKRVMLSMLPGIDSSVGRNFDGNSFKRYNYYTRLGLNIGFDLVNLVKWPAHKRQGKNKVLLEKEKRKALAMAVLTQLHIALAQHELTQRRLNYADRLAQVDEKIFIESSNQLRVGATTPNRVLQSRMNFVESALTRDWLFAERQRAVDQLYIAAGVSLAAPVSVSLIETRDPVTKLADLSRSMMLRAGRLHDLSHAMEAHMSDSGAESVLSVVTTPAAKGAVSSAHNTVTRTLQPAESIMPERHDKPSLTKRVVASPAIGAEKLWCVRAAYFTTDSLARRYIREHSVQADRELVTEARGNGFTVRSKALSFDDAYKLREQARARFAPDAFIRRCGSIPDHDPEAESPVSSSSETRSKAIFKETNSPVPSQITEPEKALIQGIAQSTEVVESGRSKQPKGLWCVHTAYFFLKERAQRDIKNIAAQGVTNLVIEATGKGFIVRSNPLSFDDAYDFRTKVRTSFSPDAYIRKCQ